LGAGVQTLEPTFGLVGVASPKAASPRTDKYVATARMDHTSPSMRIGHTIHGRIDA
jgi:hypothetical protein